MILVLIICKITLMEHKILSFQMFNCFSLRKENDYDEEWIACWKNIYLFILFLAVCPVLLKDLIILFPNDA